MMDDRFYDQGQKENKMNVLKKENDALKQEIGRLKQKIIGYKHHLNTTNGKFGTLVERELENQINDLKAENKELEIECDELRHTIDEMATERAELTQAHYEEKHYHEFWESSYDRVKQQRENLYNAVQSAENALEQQKQKIEDQENVIKALTALLRKV